MITDNFYIEKILSEYFNELGSNYNSFRRSTYASYNYCIEQDPNLNHKIKYAICASFSQLEIHLNLNTFEKLKEFLIQEELFESISEILDLHSNPIEPLKSSLIRNLKTKNIQNVLKHSMALH